MSSCHLDVFVRTGWRNFKSLWENYLCRYVQLIRKRTIIFQVHESPFWNFVPESSTHFGCQMNENYKEERHTKRTKKTNLSTLFVFMIENTSSSCVWFDSNLIFSTWKRIELKWNSKRLHRSQRKESKQHWNRDHHFVRITSKISDAHVNVHVNVHDEVMHGSQSKHNIQKWHLFIIEIFTQSEIRKKMEMQ